MNMIGNPSTTSLLHEKLLVFQAEDSSLSDITFLLQDGFIYLVDGAKKGFQSLLGFIDGSEGNYKIFSSMEKHEEPLFPFEVKLTDENLTNFIKWKRG